MIDLSLLQIFSVGAAGAVGALLRYLIGRTVAERVSAEFPLGTLLINMSGAFLIGLFAGLAGHKIITSQVQLVVATGFLGGYTTFSTMHWEGTQLMRAGSQQQGFLYLCGTYALGIPLAAFGLLLGGWT